MATKEATRKKIDSLWAKLHTVEVKISKLNSQAEKLRAQISKELKKLN